MAWERVDSYGLEQSLGASLPQPLHRRSRRGHRGNPREGLRPWSPGKKARLQVSPAGAGLRPQCRGIYSPRCLSPDLPSAHRMSPLALVPV